MFPTFSGGRVCGPGGGGRGWSMTSIRYISIEKNRSHAYASYATYGGKGGMGGGDVDGIDRCWRVYNII